MKLSLSVRLTADVGTAALSSLHNNWFDQCFQLLQELRRSGSVANLRLRSVVNDWWLEAWTTSIGLNGVPFEKRTPITRNTSWREGTALNLGAPSPVHTYCWGGAIVLWIGISAGAGVAAEAGCNDRAFNAEMTGTSMADMTAGSESRWGIGADRSPAGSWVAGDPGNSASARRWVCSL